ncbi:DNA polymerase I [SAR116 cluster bacterium]|nr:DNA polymerase I [SAR116 cluster bacterium]
MGSQRLILVDGSGYIFRAFYALPPMSREDGTPVNAVFGFTSMLLKLSEDMEGENILVVFDAARTTFRNAIYKEYKANRSEPPEELVPQFDLIKKATTAIGLKSLEVENYEADDIIATYVKIAKKENIETLVISSDKDLMQLIQDGVSLYDPMKNIKIGPEAVLEKFGVSPDKVIDVQALAGDSSDNVPGVPGIGVKTASQLINEFGSLEKLLDNASSIKQEKRRESLLNNAELAIVSKKLVSLFSDVPIPYKISDLKWTPRNDDNLLAFLKENNFKRLENRYFDLEQEGNSQPESKNIEQNYNLITKLSDLQNLIDECIKCGVIAVDTETDSINAVQANLVGVSISTKPGTAYYIPLRHIENSLPLLIDEKLDQKDKIEQINFDSAIKLLKKILQDPSIIKVGHNIKFDMLVFSQKRNGSINLYPVHDTMCMSYVNDANRYSHKLDSLAKDFFDHETIKYDDVCGRGAKQVSFDKIHPNDALNYAAEDADFCLRIFLGLKEELFISKLNSVYERIERPLINVIANMEKEGILIDKSTLNALSIEFQDKLTLLQKKIYVSCGEEFNIASPKQLGEILFEKLNLPQDKKSKTGNYSTSISVLEGLSTKGFEIADLIIEWRTLSKLKSTYTDALQESINKQTKRVHTSYSMASASTGRLASTNPNLQNIPIRTTDGRRIREAFIARDGYKLISADYSQIELRLMAHAANETEMIKAFNENVDIHSQTASKVFGIPIQDLDSEIRRSAKAINFGIIYGISAFGLSKQLSCSQSEAKNFIESYFDQFPKIKIYMDAMIENAKMKGYVETFFGRRIPIKGINSKNFQERSFAERQSINAPIQGSAADIIKRAMIKIHNVFQEKNIESKMLLQVHDELVFECPKDEINTVSNLIKKEMEQANLPLFPLNIPIVVDFGEADNWSEAH